MTDAPPNDTAEAAPRPASRPNFEEPAVETLLAMVLAVTAELAVTRDRLDRLESVLAARGLLEIAALDRYPPPDAAAQAARHQALLSRVLGPVHDELRALQARAAEANADPARY